MLIPGYITLLIALIVYLILLMQMTSNNETENIQILVTIYVIFSILLAAGIIFALFSSRFVFRLFMKVMPFEQTQIGCVIATFVTCLAFLIYAYVEKHSTPTEPKRVKKRPFSFAQKVNCIMY